MIGEGVCVLLCYVDRARQGLQLQAHAGDEHHEVRVQLGERGEGRG